MNWGTYSGTALWCLSLGLASLLCPLLGICGSIGGLFAIAATCYLLFEGAREVRQFLIDATHSKWF